MVIIVNLRMSADEIRVKAVYRATGPHLDT
jgi:hypothetical protein